jgi:hypothetical protein
MFILVLTLKRKISVPAWETLRNLSSISYMDKRFNILVHIKSNNQEEFIMNQNIILQIEQIKNKMDRLKTQKEFYEKLLHDKKGKDER